eukprot:767912-Hanusia_phi.AAC.4
MAADEEAIEEMLRFLSDNPQDILQALFSWQKLGNAAMQVILPARFQSMTMYHRWVTLKRRQQHTPGCFNFRRPTTGLIFAKRRRGKGPPMPTWVVSQSSRGRCDAEFRTRKNVTRE